MVEHTKEPWYVAENTSVRLDTAYLVRPVDNKNFEYGATVAAISERDAIRITLCVNACAGIPNADLKKVEGDVTPVFTLLMQYAKERDNAWEEGRKIREAIKANPEESTFDEVLSVLEQRDSLLHALKLARAFIANGIEVGAIRMPDSSTPDPANETLPLIDAIIAKAEAA